MKLLASLIVIIAFTGIAVALPPYLELFRYVFIAGIFLAAAAMLGGSE